MNEDVSPSRLELRIMQAVKREPRLEKAIAKELKLDRTVVAELITDLMLKGFVERRVKRRMRFFYREYFSITQEGLAALESSAGALGMIIELVREQGRRLLDDISGQLPPAVATGVRVAYRIAKFALK